MAWVAEDTFDSYTDGDLNGQGAGTGWSAAWSGDTDYDVQGTTTFNGSAKAVVVATNGGSISRTLTTAVTSGVLYFAMKCTVDHSISGEDSQLDLMVGASLGARFSFADSGNFRVSAAVNTDIIAPYSLTIFYLFEVTLNGDNTLNIRYHDGSTWSTPVTNLAYATNGDITAVRFNSGISNTNHMFYDYISPTNPFTPAGGGGHNLALLGVGT